MKSSCTFDDGNVCFSKDKIVAEVLMRNSRMRGGKDEDKRMDPLFPRLHINDADKGGPRPPPRNKMALCEQSLSPQRFTSTSAPGPGSMSMLALPSSSSNSLPAASSSLVGCNKKSSFSLSHSSSESSHIVETLHPNLSGGMNFTLGRPDIRPLKPLNSQILCLKGHLPSTSQCSPFQYSNSNPSANKFGRENGFYGPKFVASGKPQSHGNIPKSGDKERMAISSSKPSLNHFQDKKNFLKKPSLSYSPVFLGTYEEQSKETGSMQLKLREHSINQSGDLAQCQKREHCAKLPTPLQSTREKSAVHEASSPVHSEVNAKSVASSAPENRCGLVGDLNKSTDSKSESDEDSSILHKRKAIADDTYVENEDATTKRCASAIEGLSCSFTTYRDNHQSPKRVKSSSDCHKCQNSGPPEVEGTDRSEGLSEASSFNSRLVEKLSPDNVIGLIGQELFWKARRTIAHQQRIFAIQLFELHRLTKVQKLIARSPDVLLKGNFYLQQPSLKFSPLKKLPCDDVHESSVLAIEQKVSSKPNNFKHPADNTYETLLSLSKDTDKKLISQQSAQKPNVGSPTLRSFVSDPKLAPQCFQPPPGYQWLVPIRSPSEGLVYKPYTGPCPPPAGFMAPVYGSCRPMALSSIGGDFPNVPYSAPTPHKQGVGIFHGPAIFDQTCIQPYSMPVIKQSGSSSAVEQMNQLSRIRSIEMEKSLSIRDINLARTHKKLCNMSSQKTAIISDCDRTFQAGRGNDMQGSTASSPSERVQRDALSLFPVTPTAKVSEQTVQDNDTEQQIQVIKVVPHNPKSASESAARIFRSIQEERKLNY